MKKIEQLTEKEAKEILKLHFPDKNYIFEGLSFESKYNEEGEQQVTFNLDPIVGIEFYDGQDGCLLSFHDTKVVLWLYKNGYDVLELLEYNSDLSDTERNFHNFAFEISWMAKGEDGFRDDAKHNWTLDYVKNRCEELLEKYYY